MTRLDRHGFAQPEVAYSDSPSPDLRACALARVGDREPRSAHGGGAVAAAHAEVTFHAAEQAASFALPRSGELRRPAARQLSPRREAAAGHRQRGEWVLAPLTDVEEAAAEVAVLGPAGSIRRREQSHRPLPG